MGGSFSTHGERRVVYRVMVRKPEGKRPLGDPGVDGSIILRWIFECGLWGYGLDTAGSGKRQVTGS